MTIKKGNRVFVMVPNYWGVSSTIDAAFRQACRAGGPMPSDARRGSYFALEFPTGTKFEVGQVHGDWWASAKPLRLLSHHGLSAAKVERLQKLCEGGADGHDR